MTRWHRYSRLWLLLVLIAVVLVVAGVLWLRGTPPGDDHSPLSTPAAAEASPISTPTLEDTTSPPPSSWSDGSIVLLWVALGILLALGIVFAILRWHHSSTR